MPFFFLGIEHSGPKKKSLSDYRLKKKFHDYFYFSLFHYKTISKVQKNAFFSFWASFNPNSVQKANDSTTMVVFGTSICSTMQNGASMSNQKNSCECLKEKKREFTCFTLKKMLVDVHQNDFFFYLKKIKIHIDST